jgi:hypothetical protein
LCGRDYGKQPNQPPGVDDTDRQMTGPTRTTVVYDTPTTVSSTISPGVSLGVSPPPAPQQTLGIEGGGGGEHRRGGETVHRTPPQVPCLP